MFKRERNGLIAAAALIAITACGGDDAGQTGDQQATQPTATQQQIGANVELPEGVTLEMVQAGKTVFETTTCFTCHGMDASGTALAPSLRDQDWLNSGGTYPEIVEVVRNGVPQPVRYPAAMPPIGGGQLTEDQIRQVSAYVYAISHGG
jgi:cbb3-type cytochrome c oxidase subunit III